ncbi:MAG: ABC transporter substrate-binding protein [Rhizobiales bacterium]|nr:ABC transporter substrate-binding protein [Hyphomicrobiales bacterium]
MRPVMRSSSRALPTALGAVLTAATALATPATGAMAGNAERIVSIGGAVTEILYSLGLARRVVAVDSTSIYPEQALKEKPNVGYMRALSPEGVLGLNPSMILATEGSGPKETIAVLKAASVPYVTVPDRFTGEGIVNKIEVIAAAVDASARAACLAKAVQADLAALTRVRGRIEKPLNVMFLLSFMNGRPMVAGRATAADGVIRLAGAANAITAYEGYKLVNDEAVIAARPDAVLVMQRDSHPLDAKTVFQHPAFALTPAAQEHRFISMNGLYLLGFGPRTALAARDLATSLYPDVGRDAFPSERGAAPGEACR